MSSYLNITVKAKCMTCGIVAQEKIRHNNSKIKKNIDNIELKFIPDNWTVQPYGFLCGECLKKDIENSEYYLNR